MTLIEKVARAMMRECGTCNMCCKLPAVEALQKPANVWCTHCAIGNGCTIYADRPDPCRGFECLWLQGMGGLELKPDKCKAYFFVPADDAEGVTVHVDVGRAWRGTIVEQTIDKLLAAGVHVGVVQGDKRTMLYASKSEGQ